MSESFSSINTYLRCAKKYFYRNIKNLQRIRKDVLLRQGTVIHHLLMGGFLALQRGDDWTTGVEEHAYALTDEADNNAMFEEEFAESEALIWESVDIVKRYFAQTDWSEWEILHVEEEFVVEINGVELTFTPDLVARDRNGQVWVIDHKSTNAIPSDGIPFASQQSLLYFAGVKAFYPEAVGFLFNYLRKKLPTQPRLNKTKTKESGLNHVSDLNRIDTTFDILYQFLQEEAPENLAEPNHKRRLAELRDQPDRFFYTQRVLANEHALGMMIDETAMVLEAIDLATVTGNYPRTLRDDNGYESCTKCEFNSICQAELLDLNTEIVLRDYEPREDKNPYERDDDGET